MEEGHCIRTLHGEENTILQAAAVGGISTEGATLYTTFSPCYQCVKKIIAAGIKKVIVGAVYANSLSTKETLEAGGVEMIRYQPNKEWDDKLIEIFKEPLSDK
jgi:dCMP deaminase